jgi:phosphonoacetaldehyde hydrolase
MGRFKKDHPRDIISIPEVTEQFINIHGRNWTEQDISEMFDMFRPEMAKIAVTEELIRSFEGVKETIDRLRAAGIMVGCDAGYPKETYDAI